MRREAFRFLAATTVAFICKRPALLRGIEVPVERENIVEDEDATEKFVEKARTMLQR